MEVYALYMTSHPRFMTSQHSIKFISLLYLISNRIYLTTQPLHLCIHTKIIDHITTIVCMITQANMHDIMWIHMTSHPLLWYHITLWHSHTLYSCHHTQDACCRIHCSWAITYSLLIRARLQYVWYQTTICMTSYEFYVISQPLLLTSKYCIHDITSTIFLNT